MKHPNNELKIEKDKYNEALSKYDTHLQDEAIKAKTADLIANKVAENDTLEVKKFLFNCIDLTTLKTTDSEESVLRFTERVNDFENEFPELKNVAAICVYPNFANIVSQSLEVEEVGIACVSAGFPSSQTFTEVKIAETAMALHEGATEIDIVISVGKFLSGDYEGMCDEIEEILINNNIDLKDAEQSIDKNIINNLTAHINNHLEPASKFTCTHCPKCGYIHLSPMQSSYSRNIIFKIENLLIKVKISVQRLICNNCGSTHSILPSFCVPFKQYSKQAILEIVSQADKTSSQVVADKLNIESKQVRRLIKLFYSFKNDILLLYQIYKLHYIFFLF